MSSPLALREGANDGVVTVAPVLKRVGDFGAFLDEAFNEAFSYAARRKAESISRPVGSSQWLEDIEAKTGIALRPR